MTGWLIFAGLVVFFYILFRAATYYDQEEDNS